MDHKQFREETLREGQRIKNLISAAPGSGSKSIQYLIQSHCLTREEILGIEHLIIDKMAVKMLKERSVHAHALLSEQWKLQQWLTQKLDVGGGEYNPAQKLAELSSSRSSKSMKRAKIRAALAA